MKNFWLTALLALIMSGCAAVEFDEEIQTPNPQTSFSVQRDWKAVVGKTTITDTVTKTVNGENVETHDLLWVVETPGFAGPINADPTNLNVEVEEKEDHYNVIIAGNSALVSVTKPKNPFEGEWDYLDYIESFIFNTYEILSTSEQVLEQEVITTSEIQLNFSIVMGEYAPFVGEFFFPVTIIDSQETDYLKDYEVENITWYTFDLIEDFNLTGKKTTNYVATPKPAFSRKDIPVTYLMVDNLNDQKIISTGSVTGTMNRTSTGQTTVSGNWTYFNYTETWTFPLYPEFSAEYSGQRVDYKATPYPHVECLYREIAPKHTNVAVAYEETYMYQGIEYEAKVRKDTFEDVLGVFTKTTVYLKEKPVDEVTVTVQNTRVDKNKLLFDIVETHTINTELNKTTPGELEMIFNISADGPVTYSSKDSSLPALSNKTIISRGADDYDHNNFVAHVRYEVVRNYEYNYNGSKVEVSLPEGTQVETQESNSVFVEKDSSVADMDLYKYQITYDLVINSNVVDSTNYDVNIRIWRNNLETFGVDKTETFKGAVATVILNTSTKKTHHCLMLEFGNCLVAIIDGNKDNAMVINNKQGTYGQYVSVVYNNGWEPAYVVEDGGGIAYKGDNKIVTVTTSDGIVFNYPTVGNNITCFVATNITSDLNKHEVKFNGNTIVVID